MTICWISNSGKPRRELLVSTHSNLQPCFNQQHRNTADSPNTGSLGQCSHPMPSEMRGVHFRASADVNGGDTRQKEAFLCFISTLRPLHPEPGITHDRGRGVPTVRPT